MGLKTNGVEIVCEKCECLAVLGEGNFDLRVPVRDLTTGREGLALLRCSNAAGSHSVELVEWTGEASSRPSAGIEAALGRVAKLKLCGTARLCPAATLAPG